MVQVLPAYDPWESVGTALTTGFETFKERHDENAIQSSIASLGKNASARDILDAITNTNTYSPKAKKSALENYIGASKFDELKRQAQASEEIQKEKNKIEKGKISANKSQRKDLEKVNNVISGLKTIEEMEKIGAKGNLGRGSGVLKHINSETAKDFGKYEQLGKSLIQLSTTIPIRNRQEFETLAEKLYDPTIRDAERQGILEAMKLILTNSIEGLIDQEALSFEGSQTEQSQQKVKVRNKSTGKTGSVTPYEGMEAKYDRI